MSTPKRILIAGAGLAGPALAIMLRKNGHNVTIVERSPQLRLTGQQVDLGSWSLQVVEALGLLDRMREMSTGDAGIAFVRDDGTMVAKFPVGTGAGEMTFVKEIEINRSDMARVFYDASVEIGTQYVFGDFITEVSETEKIVHVVFDSGKQGDYDLLVAADGLTSRTRRIVFGTDAANIKPLNQVCAIFPMPYLESDGTWSKWWNATGGRVVMVRPQPTFGRTSTFIALITDKGAELAQLSVKEQKEKLAEIFGDCGWETPRVLREMMKTDDFYLAQVAQSKVEPFVKGRVALMGDAGYCPSPVTGKGTTLAIAGAYILAGCICTHDDPVVAFQEYNKQLRPFVDEAQQLIPGTPRTACPQTAWGIWVLYNVMWAASLVANSALPGVLSKVFGPIASMLGIGKELELPTYPAMKGVDLMKH